MKSNLTQKLTSRKFLLAALAVISGILALIFGENQVIQTVMGALMVILPAVVYCITEGKIDAASVASISSAVTDAAEELGASEHAIKSLETIGDAVETLAEAEE